MLLPSSMWTTLMLFLMKRGWSSIFCRNTISYHFNSCSIQLEFSDNTLRWFSTSNLKLKFGVLVFKEGGGKIRDLGEKVSQRRRPLTTCFSSCNSCWSNSVLVEKTTNSQSCRKASFSVTTFITGIHRAYREIVSLATGSASELSPNLDEKGRKLEKLGFNLAGWKEN